MHRVTGYYTYTAQGGDTWDLLALDMYNDETLLHVLMQFNPDYAGVLIFSGGEKLRLPILEKAETTGSVAPWKEAETDG